MSASGVYILVILAMSCCAAPNPEKDHCEKPEQIKGAQLQGEWHDKTYPPGKVANFACLPEYTQDGPIKMACIEGTWWHIAKGQCKEILCSPYDPVVKGKLVVTKTQYKIGDEIDVQCEEGYVLQIEPNKRRECTANGWSPSTRCVSKKCDRPDIKHGIIDRDYYYPKEVGRYLYYKCERNYQPRQWIIIYCTNAGWKPEPKCSRECSYTDAYFENAQLIDLKPVYVEGDKVQFRCIGNYQTPDGINYGERTCLPNGKFTPAKCSVTCTAPQLQNGKFNQIKNEYEIGEFLQYECNKGYMTESRHLSGKSQCRDGRWSEAPHCIPITCEYNRQSFNNGDIIKYRCPNGQKPRSDIGQCYYFGWGPPLVCQGAFPAPPHPPQWTSCHPQHKWKNAAFIPLPSIPISRLNCYHAVLLLMRLDARRHSRSAANVHQTANILPDVHPLITTGQSDIECTIPESSNLVPSPFANTYKINRKVSFSCKGRFVRSGSLESVCTEGGWNPLLPTCKDKIPTEPDSVAPDSKDEKGIIQCQNPPTIKNGIIKSSKQEIYATDDVVKYSCRSGFHISGSDQSTCVNGHWSTFPTCTEDECANAPNIQHGTAIENKKTFSHGERAKYKCDNGFRFKDEDIASCVEGQWMNIPVCVSTSCKSPPFVANAKPKGGPKSSYASGEKVTYVCNYGYSLERSGEAQCDNTNWINIPVCRKIGEQCGPPPTVQYGETVDIRKVAYRSGERVEFRCPEYYILDGNRFVTCLNGVWNDAPVCIEPCTAKERDMESNNIQLRWKPDRKLYSRHGETMEFVCKPGHEALPNTQMKISCDQGNLEYPKCFKSGFCVLEQSTMIANNIHYNLSTVVDHGQRILFQCNDGMMAENKLEAKCEWRKINYPRCTAAKSCKTPEILNGFIKTEQASYDSGSYVEFDCNEGYVIDLAMKVKCENGHWSKLPVCYSPCKISPEELTKHNIQLLSSNDQKNIPDKSYKHGTEISVACKSGFRRSTNAALVLKCYDGKFRYPRCFSRRTCRILQDDLDENNLELDEVHDNEVFYAEGEIIHYKCKNGFYYLGQPTGKCSEEIMSYPKCTEESSV